MAKLTKKARKYIGNKIRKLRKEGKSAKQAAGQAFGMARQLGYKIAKRGS